MKENLKILIKFKRKFLNNYEKDACVLAKLGKEEKELNNL